jgi:pSer/pThr/pTyr-binding forkhead associated (FHA) protein
MLSGRTFWFALMGATAGAVTWAIATPHLPSLVISLDTATKGIRPEDQFTLGTFYGWFSSLLLGALIAGPIAFGVAITRNKLPKAILLGVLATVVGAATTCGADAAADYLLLNLTKRSGMPFMPYIPLWELFVPIALALSIALCTQPTWTRIMRALKVGLWACVLTWLLRGVLGTAMTAVVVGQAVSMAKDQMQIDMWQMMKPLILAQNVAFGLAMGIAFSLVETVGRTAWVRHLLGRNEGRVFGLFGPANRIGSAEGLEVPIFGDPALAPVHAQIVLDGRQFVIHDLAGGMMLNGWPVQSAVLVDNTVIQLGSTMLQFGMGPVRAAVPVMPAPVVAPAQVPVAVSPAVEVPRFDPRLIDPFGKVISLMPGRNVVGRSQDATIPFEHDGLVSRSHAEILIDGGIARISDLGSRNGTHVNGSAVSETLLQDGDRVRFGSTECVYRTT